jgi:hypothetical protein
MKKTWDLQKREHIETPEKMLTFFDEIKAVCEKHNLSISHEDGHGGFIVTKFDENNIDWLSSADKDYDDEDTI